MDKTVPTDAILNPYTPLVFLAPNIAYQFQLICYINVATLAVSPMQCLANRVNLTCRLTGIHMGLAHGDSGGVQNYPQSGIQQAQYRIFLVEVHDTKKSFLIFSCLLPRQIRDTWYLSISHHFQK
jgi:hypothetical protein